MKGFGYNILSDKQRRPSAKRLRPTLCLSAVKGGEDRIVDGLSQIPIETTAMGWPITKKGRARATYRATRRNALRRKPKEKANV